MKKLALDLDGVVFDSENLYRVYTEIYDTDYHKKDTLVDNSQRIFQKRYNWSKEEFDRFYGIYAERVIADANIMSGAEVVLNKLKDKYEFIIVTARTDFEMDIAAQKLKEVGLGNIKVFNNKTNKMDIFIKEKVDYIIEDDESICIKASEQGIKALYLKNNASKPTEDKGVINVNNWGEIYKYLVLKEK